VAVDGAKVLQAELLEEDGGPQHALGGLFGPARHFDRGLAADLFNDAASPLVQVVVVLVGDDPVEVAGDGAHIAVDGPLVVVEHDDHPFRLVGDIVEGLKGDSIGEGRVAGDGDDVLLAARQIASHGHSQGRGESRSGVPRSEGVVLALGAQHEAVEAARLADGLHAVQAAGEHLVDVGLMAHVEEQLVFRGVEDGVKGQGKLDDPEVRAQMTAGLRERLNEERANLLRQFVHLRKAQALEIGGRVDGLQQCSHGHPSSGKKTGQRSNNPPDSGELETSFANG
jgi:hypothetical protein